MTLISKLLQFVRDNPGVTGEEVHKEFRPEATHRIVRKVEKTPEMLAEEKRLWGGSLMGLGASMLAVGAGLFKSGLRP